MRMKIISQAPLRGFVVFTSIGWQETQMHHKNLDKIKDALMIIEENTSAKRCEKEWSTE